SWRARGDLYAVGALVLAWSVVAVALTAFSKHQLVREPTRDECRASLRAVGVVAARALAERGHPWCFGADELYLKAGERLPAAAWYGEFEQRENGVGAVRYLQTRIAAAQEQLGEGEWRGKRIAVATGKAMGPRMAPAVAPLADPPGAAVGL